MENLKTVDQYDALKNEGKHIFLFSAAWCVDCRVIEPFMPEIEKKFPDFTFIHVDRDEFIDVCAANDVFGIPSFIGYDNGKELGRYVSRDRKTQEQIEEFIQSL
ncbi:thioredoxin family protein [Peribacillus muralis]|uniref:thioredoxin family protein n=1 Tax=Peribacillus muralis TaxID=264697 RepID=UPI001F4D91B4|nr:thioredoxin family protein [Peribacillus muralis]MCK1991890.1 thioredoxin family protein [Peribacillus muralis]MCK2012448.1 thioredoxin family protein [Peribacillus muralis]